MLQPNIILELGEESVNQQSRKSNSGYAMTLQKGREATWFQLFQAKYILLNHTMAISFVLSCSVHVMLEQGHHSCHSNKLPH